jgi:general stress protein 26
MLTTFPKDADRPHVRPMYTQNADSESFDGTLWFMTDADSAKVHELATNHGVVVTYSAPDKNRYVVAYGNADVERNPEKARELWNIHAKGWYPGGPDDPNLLLIRVRVESADYWDGPSNTMYMLSLLRAVATGKRINADGEQGTVKG